MSCSFITHPSYATSNRRATRPAPKHACASSRNVPVSCTGGESLAFNSSMPPVHGPATPSPVDSANLTSAACADIVDIGDVLATAAAAAACACELIREVQTGRSQGAALTASYKDISDPRSALTIADQRAQTAIVGTLRRDFPGINIVAEEDQVDSPLAIEIVDGVTRKAPRVPIETPKDLRAVPLSEVCVFVDPVDATLQFVNENLEAVQTLVGISFRGRAVAGAIGLPFHDNVPVVCGIVGAGVVNLPGGLAASRPHGCDSHGAVLTSSENPRELPMQITRQIIDPAYFVPRAGAGNKIMAVASGAADVTILNVISSLWDTCAPEAILTALGGKVTDLFGNPIRYAVDAHTSNCYGAIATSARFPENDIRKRSHGELCAQLRHSAVADALLVNIGLVPSYPGQIQATDIARDVNGDLLTISWLRNVSGFDIQSFAAPESSAVRYLMSDAVRLELTFTSSASTADSPRKSQKHPVSFFYKRIAMQDLEHVKNSLKTSPQKVQRDVTSYKVEAEFLSSRPCCRLRDSGLHIVRPYHLASRPAQEGESLLNSCFASLMEDFSPTDGWSQSEYLNGELLHASLSSLAHMHAFFWSFDKDPDYPQLQSAIWQAGTYWTPERLAADQFKLLGTNWKQHVQNFREVLGEANVYGTDALHLDDIGQHLSKLAPQIAHGLHSAGVDPFNPFRTVIHGDPKAANFFFKNLGDSGKHAKENILWDVGMIDFQWTGFGCPAVDVAYLIGTSAGISELSLDGSKEMKLVEFYHKCIVRFLVQFGKARDENSASALIPLDTLKILYEEALLDLARLAFSYHWVRLSASPTVLKSRENLLESNSYNKSVPHAVWLIARTASLLSTRLTQ